LNRRFGKVKIIDRIGDVIRYGLIEKSAADNVLLVGDAACQVKPFSLGGIIYGKIGAEFAAKACIEALENNEFSENFFLENYDFKWKRKLKLPIMKGIVIKKIFSFFQDNPTFFETIKNLNLSNFISFFDVDLL
jgi:flavin-dependent dehydrogenase